jgi:hypothetical protein
MKNKDIMEWMLDEGIDPLTTVTTGGGEMYLSDVLTKHLTEQLRGERLFCDEHAPKARYDWQRGNCLTCAKKL